MPASDRLAEPTPASAVVSLLPDSKKRLLKLHGINKVFNVAGKPLTALHGIDFSVNEGEFVCIVGASGCGKSTILRLIAGLDFPTSGSVEIAGSIVQGPGADRAIVFQEHRLFPWRTVAENVFLGLDATDLTLEQKRRAVAEHIALVGLQGFEDAYPSQLSGGMSQRAAIARSLVVRPRILLLDEPLGALDALTRAYLQQELLRIWAQQRTTTIMVTHDVEEAVFLADRVIVLQPRPGRIDSIVEIALPRPRDRASIAFAQKKASIFEVLQQ